MEREDVEDRWVRPAVKTGEDKLFAVFNHSSSQKSNES